MYYYNKNTKVINQNTNKHMSVVTFPYYMKKFSIAYVSLGKTKEV